MIGDGSPLERIRVVDGGPAAGPPVPGGRPGGPPADVPAGRQGRGRHRSGRAPDRPGPVRRPGGAALLAVAAAVVGLGGVAWWRLAPAGDAEGLVLPLAASTAGVPSAAAPATVEAAGPGSVAATGLPAAAPTGSPRPASEVTLHVAGAVRSPGVVVVAPGARVVDAVAAAGGLLAEADPDAVNLARQVADGELVVVPTPGQDVGPPAGGGAPAGGGTGTPAGGATAVDLNTAGPADLDALPGIGPVLAERIVTWREDTGPFVAVEDLLAVPGIGQRVLEELRPLVTV